MTMLGEVGGPLREWLTARGLLLHPLPEGDPDQYIVVPAAGVEALGGTVLLDEVWPNGLHRYWSTHCRHGRHDDCDATTIGGPLGAPRKPAQCKTCEAPCRCRCHAPAGGGSGVRRLSLVADPVGRTA